MESLLKEVEKEITAHFGEEVLQMVKAGFATIATLALQIYQPTSLIYVGASGSAKTTVCSLLTPDSSHQELKEWIIRIDKFTPASFVTHAANRKKEELAKIDLLPRVKDRCLITKELAPLFRGKETDLQENFSILISVLDGKGYVSSSGVQGTRGYDEEISFSWLGATTPLSNQVHKIMAQLGTRLVFYNTDGEEKSIDDLVKFAKRTNTTDAEATCRQICNGFLGEFFKSHPVRTIPEDALTFPEHLLERLVRYVVLMCHLRAGFSMKENGVGEKIFSKPELETPYRAIKIFKNIAYGAALIHGRLEVNEDDLSQIEHIAYSSMPEQRRLVFHALVENGGEMNTNEVIERTKMSRPTALNYMEELGHLGVVSFERGDSSTPSVISLESDFSWLIESSVKESGVVSATA